MKRLIVLVALLGLALPVCAKTRDPWAGFIRDAESFRVVVVDTTIGTSWARVTSDTGFTQLSAEDTVLAAFAAQSKFDSLMAGNLGAGLIRLAWSGGSTADNSPNANFAQDLGQAQPVSIPAPSASYFSPDSVWLSSGNAYHIVTDAAACSLSGNWTIATWSSPVSAGNPGVGKVQLVMSGRSSADVVEIGYDQRGYAFGRVSDDGGTNWDSVGVAADIYDAGMHFIALQSVTAGSDSLRLFVDHRAPASTVFSNAGSTVPIDTVEAFAGQGSNTFVGMVDQIFIIEDTTAFNQDMRDYVPGGVTPVAGWTADLANLVIKGIDPNDSTFADTSLSIPTRSAIGINDSLLLFERAFLDTPESAQIVVFSNATSPATSRLLLIPSHKYHCPTAVITVPAREKLTVDRIKVGVLDVAHGDIITFEARGYYNYADAMGAGGSGGAVIYGRRVVDSTIGPSEAFIEGPFTIQGPAVFEVWAKAAASNSLGFVEIYGKRGKQH